MVKIELREWQAKVLREELLLGHMRLDAWSTRAQWVLDIYQAIVDAEKQAVNSPDTKTPTISSLADLV